MMYKTPTFAEPQQCNRPFSTGQLSAFIIQLVTWQVLTRSERKKKIPETSACGPWLWMQIMPVVLRHFLNFSRVILRGSLYYIPCVLTTATIPAITTA
jgi:hypothetical protein